MTTVITFGTFDVLHVGHLRILQRSRDLGDRLVVGVSSDALNVAKKGREPVFSQDERCELVANLKCVDEVFVGVRVPLEGLSRTPRGSCFLIDLGVLPERMMLNAPDGRDRRRAHARAIRRSKTLQLRSTLPKPRRLMNSRFGSYSG